MAEKSKSSATICPDCGEKCPPQFDLCWRCGSALRPEVSPAAKHDADPKPETASDDAATAIAAPEFAIGVESHIDGEIAIAQPNPTWIDWCEFAGVVLLTSITPLVWHFYLSPSDDAGPYTSFLNLPIAVGWSMLLWALIQRNSQSMVQPVSLARTNWFLELGSGFLVFIGRWVVAIGVVLFANIMMGPKAAPPEDWFPSAEQPAVAAVLFYYFVSAIYEELLFRAYLQPKLQVLLKGRVVLAIALSALIFSVSHFYPFRDSLILFATGAYYGAVYYAFRSLPRLVFAHWLQNVMTAYL